MPEALRLSQLSLRGFRNLDALSLSPGPRFNVVFGDNGQGKSNLLEAIDYLGTLRSFRGATAQEMIQEGSDVADLHAQISGDVLPHDYRVRLARHGARQMTVDGKRPRSRAHYTTGVQMVLFCPADLQLITGTPEQRRTFIDRMLAQFDATYASTYRDYERALRSRNRLLKSAQPDRRAIVAFDELLASAGAVIGQTRAQLVQEMAPSVETAFEQICGEELPLQMVYEPRVRPDVQTLRSALSHSLSKDLARGFTAEGPHADELGFRLRSSRAKRFGSQGQHRAIVLSLRVAELHELSRRVGRVPILLLDDVSSELDRTRSRRLFSLLAKLGGQVFLTTTDREFILLDEERHDFLVEAGRVSEQA